MTSHLRQAVGAVVRRMAGTEGDDHHYYHGDDGEHHSEFGVHIEYEDLYDSIVFLSCIYIGGQVAARVLRMPNLVGEIVVGILLGPPLADYVPNPEAWVLLGEIGLVLLVLEAGIDIDVSTLKLIGTRGFLIATVGSILPIGMGIALALLMNGTSDVKAAIAAGAAFGPTSLGIALNILRNGGVLNTPVGQLIISAAVIDDMIALIVLSQLESLKGTIDVVSVLVPVVSAMAFLLAGGYVALFIAPGFIERVILRRIAPKEHGKVELSLMFGILIAMMPATYYAEASYLMGAFVAGLAFCTSHELHITFVQQFKRLIQWLMRIFFAASIGFQVPIKDFGDFQIIWQGIVFTLALLGKLAVGFMVPNFTQSRKFTGMHLRDCLVTGFSMAAEGEFAFVIAVFAADNELISEDLYASVVLAVLWSTIVPPFLLRYTINYYNKKSEDAVRQIANEEIERNHDLESDVGDEHEEKLKSDIKAHRAVFLCIQTHSDAKWGLLPSIMSTLARLGLDIIDHRAWHPRGINTTLVNEIYARDRIQVVRRGSSSDILGDRMGTITKALEETINQPDVAKVKVQRWYPGVVEEIVEDVDENKHVKGQSKVSLEERLLSEASMELSRKQHLQTEATKAKSIEEILAGVEKSGFLPVEGGEESKTDAAVSQKQLGKGTSHRRRRQKMRSTPVVGGGLFGESSTAHHTGTGDIDVESGQKKSDLKLDASVSGLDFRKFSQWRSGHEAEITVEGETYHVRIDDEVLKALVSGYSGDTLSASLAGGIRLQHSPATVVNQLRGFVRSPALTSNTLGKIAEEHSDLDSEHDPSHPGKGFGKAV